MDLVNEKKIKWLFLSVTVMMNHQAGICPDEFT
jgi:hypothetical protein